MIKFKAIIKNFSEYKQIYTDDSKQGEKVGAAALLPNGAQKSVRLPDKSSIYTAELRALLLALELFEGSIKKQFIIFSDSLSAMQALNNPHADHPLVGEILSWLTNITVHLELSIFFCRVPGHIGIHGNEQVDNLAKLAVNLDTSEEPKFFKDLKPSINEHLTNLWQNRWSRSSPNKLLEIVPDLRNWRVPLLQQKRKDEVIMCRSHLGHARLTHSYLFKNEDPPECIYCACRLTVKHILIECPDFELSRRKYFNCNSLPELFEKKHQKQILWHT